ncbi:MAG: hypothetical protein SNJ77_11450 [Cytophagales bacterium]
MVKLTKVYNVIRFCNVIMDKNSLKSSIIPTKREVEAKVLSFFVYYARFDFSENDFTPLKLKVN